jgi:FkbM family methyltransferase
VRGLSRIDGLRLRLGLRPLRRIATTRLGSSYGGTSVPLERLSVDSVVYSAGVGEDVTFDLALIEKVGCKVWAFDPTPRSLAYTADLRNPNFVHLPYALWASDTSRQFFVPADQAYVSHSLVNLQGTDTSIEVSCRSLGSVMQELGHDRIDLLKLDIEGAEYEVLRSMGSIRPRVLCVEFHSIDGMSAMIAFARSLPYDPICVNGRNVTFLAPT